LVNYRLPFTGNLSLPGTGGQPELFVRIELVHASLEKVIA
jgi:hypothetical protein